MKYTTNNSKQDKKYKLIWKGDRNCVTVVSQKRLDELNYSFVCQQFEVVEIK